MYTAALYSDTVYSIYYIVLLYVSSLGIQDRTNSYVPQKDEVMSLAPWGDGEEIEEMRAEAGEPLVLEQPIPSDARKA